LMPFATGSCAVAHEGENLFERVFTVTSRC